MIDLIARMLEKQTGKKMIKCERCGSLVVKRGYQRFQNGTRNGTYPLLLLCEKCRREDIKRYSMLKFQFIDKNTNKLICGR